MQQLAHHQHGRPAVCQTNSMAADVPFAAHQPANQSISTVVALVDDGGAAAFFGCSKRTFTSFMGAPWMPRPINLGPRLRRWSIDELRAAVASMPRQTERAQPEGLLRARIERMKATGAAA